ncbi:MAG: hypothetical protein Q8L46_00455 [candidate division WWE3 bacterium]|nr:hypothetical protein [candidate division WWE3 bacterium]
MADDDLNSYSPKEGEREKRREKKRRPRMQISGRSVIGLAQMIVKRAQPPPKRRKK